MPPSASADNPARSSARHAGAAWFLASKLGAAGHLKPPTSFACLRALRTCLHPSIFFAPPPGSFVGAASLPSLPSARWPPLCCTSLPRTFAVAGVRNPPLHELLAAVRSPWAVYTRRFPPKVEWTVDPCGGRDRQSTPALAGGMPACGAFMLAGSCSASPRSCASGKGV